MNGTCKLCGNICPLTESHIVPDFYIRGLEHDLVTGSKGVAQPHSILLSADSDIEGGAKQRGHWERVLGIKEYLLCQTCEKKFAEHENYVRRLLYGTAPPPIKKLSVGSAIALPDLPRASEGILGARRALVDYNHMKLFQLSILWRAGVASGSFFEQVDLGEFHETKLKRLLSTDDPGSAMDYTCVMMDLQHNGDGCETWIETPRRSRDEHQVGYQFILGGYIYLFTVSKQRPRPSAEFCCVKPSGEMIIMTADATNILRSRAKTLQKLGRI